MQTPPALPSTTPPAVPAPVRSGRSPAIAAAVWITLTVGIAGGVIALIGWLGLRTEYSQATPEEVLKSAINMVKDGNATRLSDLMYADNVEYRSTLTRLGKLCGTLQDLGKSINERFPAEVARMRDDLKSKTEGSEATIVAALTEGSRSGTIRIEPPKNAAEQRQREDSFQAFFANVFADPFGWLAEGAAKLATEKTADDTAVVKYDGEPLLGGLITLKEIDGRWWIVLPLNLPGVNQYAPQTRNEWAIVASLLKAIDSALGELRDDVKAGKVHKVDDLAQAAGEKAFIPAAVIMVMYGKEMDVRTRRDRALKDFKKRWREWEKNRLEDGVTIKYATDAVNKAALEGLDKLVRKRTATLDRAEIPMPKFEGMPETELVALVQGWLETEGAKDFKLTPPITEKAAKAAVAAIDANAKSGIRVKPKSLK